MQRIAFLLTLCCGLAAMAAVPRVSNVAMTSYGKCRITYTLSEAPGIVTFDILTNGVSIGAQNLTNAVGDVNRLVQPGNRTIKWNAHDVWPGHKFATPCVTARVTVWPENAPPDWLAVDLTKAECPVSYYTSEMALPWGRIWQNKKYKGDVMLMRKIPASHVLSFVGSPEAEANHVAGRETRRMCTLTNDFYMAIYPMTFRQFNLLQKGPTSDEQRLSPVWRQSYNMLRYNSANKDGLQYIDFPSKTGRTVVGGSSMLKAWRDKTGLVLDLPTAAQWEFACRAGTDTPLYYGDGSMGNLSTISQLGGIIGYEVGTLAANGWMLFDMIGNCYEWCLDYFEDNITAAATTDPLGPTSAANVQRKIRGYHTQDIHKRAAFIGGSGHLTQQDEIGFRLCITLF